jgi:hypothetical protein
VEPGAKWRAAISSNARVIFGEEITEEAIKIFGCAVLENMQRYMADLKGLVSMVKNAGDVVVREAIKTGSS